MPQLEAPDALRHLLATEQAIAGWYVLEVDDCGCHAARNSGPPAMRPQGSKETTTARPEEQCGIRDSTDGTDCAGMIESALVPLDGRSGDPKQARHGKERPRSPASSTGSPARA
jgi:hypothetical protein